MDVFLIPCRQGYQLYCEVGEEVHDHAAEEQRGWRKRAYDRFTSIVAGVEAARHDAARRRAERVPRSFVRRVRDRVVCWLAEKIAEQRLLWHLHRQKDATAWFPDDIIETDAHDIVMRTLRTDAQRHGRWALVHAVLALFSLALTPIPGPNLPGYYFTFRLVGHYLSRLGARHGLLGVAWHLRPASELTELRHAVALEPADRAVAVADIASRLRLEHLGAFVDRIAVRAA